MRFVFAEMQRQGITYVEMAERSGISRETLTAWRVRYTPDLTSLEAVLGVLGIQFCNLLEPVPRKAEEEEVVERIRQRVKDAQDTSIALTREENFRRSQVSIFDVLNTSKRGEQRA